MPRAAQGKPPKDEPVRARDHRLFGNTLRMVLNRVVQQAKNGQEAKTNMMLVAEELVSKAKGGDVAAIKEIADRIDGKVSQHINNTFGEDGKALPQNITVMFVGTHDSTPPDEEL